MRPFAAMPALAPLIVRRKRRAFGLDAPRPRDARRLEAAILDWLGTRLPGILALRADEPAGKDAPEKTSTLVLLLPDGRTAILRIEAGAEPIGGATLTLVEHCRRRRIPLSVVGTVEEVRAALRCLGIEPGEA